MGQVGRSRLCGKGLGERTRASYAPCATPATPNLAPETGDEVAGGGALLCKEPQKHTGQSVTLEVTL